MYVHHNNNKEGSLLQPMLFFAASLVAVEKIYNVLFQMSISIN